MLRHTVCIRERKSERERRRHRAGEKGIVGARVFAADIRLFARKDFDIYLYGCVSIRKQQVILVFQANENRVSRRGRSDCGRREGDEREQERDAHTGRARFLD